MRNLVKTLAAAVTAAAVVGVPAINANAQTVAFYSISGVAFQDTNRNGVKDAGENVYARRMVNLHDSTSRVIAKKVADTQGRFTFNGLPAGKYKLTTVTFSGETFTRSTEVNLTRNTVRNLSTAFGTVSAPKPAPASKTAYKNDFTGWSAKEIKFFNDANRYRKARGLKPVTTGSKADKAYANGEVARASKLGMRISSFKASAHPAASSVSDVANTFTAQFSTDSSAFARWGRKNRVAGMKTVTTITPAISKDKRTLFVAYSFPFED